jgi:hypothetical protein
MKPGPLYTEDGWFQALRCPEFTAYQAVSRPPLQGSRSEILAARTTLWATPLIRDLLSTQGPEGDWPSYLPEQPERLWFRQFPIPLTVLCDAGFTLDDEPVRRGSAYLLSTLEDGVFRNPWRDIDEPLQYYEAHIGHCLEAVGRCGLAGFSRVRRAVEVALSHQRWDGGWSTRPAIAYAEGEPRPDPEPSCEVCTAIMVRGLGLAGRLPAEAVERIMAYRLDERSDAPVDWWIPELLLQLEFLARQGRRLDDPHVRRLLGRLNSARDDEGAFLPHESHKGYYPPEYTQMMYDYLRWWLGDHWA